MEYIKTNVDGVYILEPKVFNDARGYFFEAWKDNEFREHIGVVDFVGCIIKKGPIHRPSWCA